ncbi:MAG: c-type cytochrome [Anaerolineales bacterium]
MQLLKLGIGAFLIVLAGWNTALAQTEGDPERGGELYIENCAVCHGADGTGRIGVNLENFPAIDVGAVLETTIAEGVAGSVMPAWGRANGGPLSAQDIADISTYIQGAFAGSDPVLPAPTYIAPQIEPLPDIEGDPSAGAVVYQTNCVACHGDQGQGRFGLPLAKSWPGNQPAVYIRSVASDGIQGTTMPAWAQTNGGPLSAEDIANVAAYVLSLTPVGTSPQPPPLVTEGPITASTVLLILVGVVLVGIIIGIVYFRGAQEPE